MAATGLDSSQDLAIHISRRKWIFVGPYKRGPRPDSDIQSKRNKRNTVIQWKKTLEFPPTPPFLSHPSTPGVLNLPKGLYL